MAEPTEQLDELDFEGQGLPPQTAVPGSGVSSDGLEDEGRPPVPSGDPGAATGLPAEDGEEDFEPFQVGDLDGEELAELGLSRDDLTRGVEEGEEPPTIEDLEQWVEADPAGAAVWLANYQSAIAAEQMRAEAEQRLAPVVAKHNTDTARETLETLHGEFGKDVVELHKDTLAAAITQAAERGDGLLLNPETRTERLREVLRAAERERLVAHIRGDDVKDEIDRFEAHPDAFGTAWTPKPLDQEPSLVPPAAAQPATEAQPTEQARDPETGRFVRLQDGTYVQARPSPGNVHVEGASHQGQPPSPAEVDPEIAEIDAVGAKRDVFGRSPGW
jgi:hypothetical protein